MGFGLSLLAGVFYVYNTSLEKPESKVGAVLSCAFAAFLIFVGWWS